ncbi:hypothetical protein SAMN06265171_101258 [Chryseobacterium rhizoplanae]|uniref:Uncharacterized protein n=1 Tax=Chryseobacterium rhizoplanae TaxID=1609531 RepID=A0A521ALU6_9FLAO|nr:hypothetical protein [Chryseobacterium rhizoplanae]SMO35788.1 hypothetical protein SAMN06265171_101258 [Chryseobacterium rhizoplanae]
MNLDNRKFLELNEAQMRNISGGESGWYWVMYTVGGAVRWYTTQTALAASAMPH